MRQKRVYFPRVTHSGNIRKLFHTQGNSHSLNVRLHSYMFNRTVQWGRYGLVSSAMLRRKLLQEATKCWVFNVSFTLQTKWQLCWRWPQQQFESRSQCFPIWSALRLEDTNRFPVSGIPSDTQGKEMHPAVQEWLRVVCWNALVSLNNITPSLK
jgi:hypothetical protein